MAFHLRLAARLDTWLDSSLLCLSTPHMLWTRGENTLQGSGVHATKPQPSSHSSSVTPTPHRYNPVQMLLIKGEKQWNHLLNLITVSLNHCISSILKIASYCACKSRIASKLHLIILPTLLAEDLTSSHEAKSDWMFSWRTSQSCADKQMWAGLFPKMRNHSHQDRGTVAIL